MSVVRLPFIGAIVLVVVAAVLPTSAQPLFQRFKAEETGIDFRHRADALKVSKDSLGKINAMVPGCGVAIGDITGDGKPDLVFSSFSDVGFFRNDGDWKFTDITATTGYPSDSLQFSTGVNLVDIDADGDLDVFVARWQNTCRLLINDGTGKFTEQAAKYGLDFLDETVHSAFFDYDKDGLLDCYLVIYSNFYSLAMTNRQNDSLYGKQSEERQRSGLAIPKYRAPGESERSDQLQRLNEISPTELRHAGHTDKMYRNQGDGTFKDVSYEAWMLDKGMGLSATVGDINLDGWPDLYVANDFNSTDLIYINNGDGTFAEKMMKMTRRASVFSMGSDIADLTGNGLPDIVTTDMLPGNHFRRILNSGNNGDMSIFNPTYDSNQVSRNMVQINRGLDLFSDVGYLTGMAATDWSWACLIQDFDLDGLPDVFIGNGYASDISNQDYIYNIQARQLGILPRMGYLTEPNCMYRQRGYLDFEDVAKEWGLAEESSTFGAAYGDIDGDGDLDLVVANLDTIPWVYRNMAKERGKGASLSITFTGSGGNTQGLGAKVRVVAAGRSYYREHYPVRGYQSCMDHKMVVGLANATVVDSVIVEWPDGPVQVLTDIPVNTTVALNRANAETTTISPFRIPKIEKPLFTETTRYSGLNFYHIENFFDDFKRYRLAPTRVSWGGPAVAVGDVNGDGLDDVFFGDGKGRSIATFVQKTPGTFARMNVGLDGADTTYETQAMVLIDVDGDGDRDLVVAGGGPEFMEDERERGLRVYLNNGKGQFTRTTEGVPTISTNATTINACDYDNDGDLDIFVGGGVATDKYPMPARSYLLRNDGKGTFTDVTASVLPGIAEIGIVRSALWSDVDNDGRFDLLVCGEWMPITVFKNEKAGFRDVTESLGLASTTGWWYSIQGADIDNDGDIDYIAGNLGLNSRYQPTQDKPIEIWAADFDDNGSIDPLVTIWFEGKRHLVRDRGKIFSQMPTLNRRFNEFVEFATATIDKVVDQEQLDTAYYRNAKLMASVVLINEGGAKFTVKPLPKDAQISPIKGIEAIDLNEDDLVDLIVVGNEYGAEDDVVRYDAGKGLVLINQGSGEFRSLPLAETGFISQYDARGLVSVRNPGSDSNSIVLISAVNQRAATTYAPKGVALRVQKIDPRKVTSALFTVSSGKRKVEVYCGSAYRSQTSCNMVVPPGATAMSTSHSGKNSGTIQLRKP